MGYANGLIHQVYYFGVEGHWWDSQTAAPTTLESSQADTVSPKNLAPDASTINNDLK